MIVVSGCPRSGTSLMMRCLRSVYGEDRVVGGRGFDPEPEEDVESPRMRCVKYLRAKQVDKRRDKARDMNPDGFWECGFTVRGVFYHVALRDLLEKLESPSGKIVKIVCQGLPSTDPRYVDSVILMLRDPHEVATSQERLTRPMPFEMGGSSDMSDHMRIHSPQMFITVVHQAARWFSINDHVPVKVVRYGDLVTDWRTSLRGVTDFLGGGDHELAEGVVKKKLHRSEWDPEDSGPLWREAERVFSLAEEKNWEGITSFLDDPRLECHYRQIRFHCPRYGFPTDPIRCGRCSRNENARRAFQAAAERKGLEWRKEPCLWECGMNPRNENPSSIEASVAQNEQ